MAGGDKNKEGAKSGGGTDSGLDENIAGALCYLLGFVTGILFYLIEKKNRFVRFHAVQSIVSFAAIFILFMLIGILGFIFAFIPWIGGIVGILLGLLSLLLSLLAFILWIFLMYKAYSGEEYKLPVVGDLAVKHSAPGK